MKKPFQDPKLLDIRSTEDGLTMRERFEAYDRAAGQEAGTFLKMTELDPPKGLNPYDEW